MAKLVWRYLRERSAGGQEEERYFVIDGIELLIYALERASRHGTTPSMQGGAGTVFVARSAEDAEETKKRRVVKARSQMERFAKKVPSEERDKLISYCRCSWGCCSPVHPQARSSVWLERFLDTEEVDGSSPFGPTIVFNHLRNHQQKMWEQIRNTILFIAPTPSMILLQLAKSF